MFDKLAISYLEKTSYSGNLFEAIGNDGLEKVKRQDILAAAYIILAQGTPFLNGGQEFLRTKQGNENSYNSSDEINQIDLEFKTRYSDIFNAYKGLLAFRRENSDSFGSKTDCSAQTIFPGFTKYTAGKFCIYFNATDSSARIDSAGFTNSIDVLSGKPEQKDFVPNTMEAKSFVILKKSS